VVGDAVVGLLLFFLLLLLPPPPVAAVLLNSKNTKTAQTHIKATLK
jgi:hypothetical protein